MVLRFLGKDPNSPINNSPTIYDNGDTYVIQGWKITDLAVLQELGELPEHETVVEMPKRMMQFFPEVAGDEGSADVRGVVALGRQNRVASGDA